MCYTLQNGDKLSIYQKGLLYRHIQILAAMLNELQTGPPILIIISGPTLFSALVMSTLVESWDSDILFVATLVINLVDCIVLIIAVLGQMSTVCRNSSKTIELMSVKPKAYFIKRDHKWEQRFYKSCTPIKVIINSGNFVDSLTPLNCLQLSFSLSVNILLLNGSSR